MAVEKKKAAEGGKARVLRHAHVAGKIRVPGEVVDLTAAELEAHTNAGDVDAHPDAVAYAESLKA